KVVTLAGFCQKRVNGAAQVAQGDGNGLIGQVIKQRGGVIKKQRQVIFYACKRNAVADVTVRKGAAGVALEYLSKAGAKAGAGLFVHGELAPRQQLYVIDRVQAALAFNIEAAYGLDLVVEKINAVGQHGTHGKQVNQPAPYGKLARRVDLGDMAVVGQHQLLAQSLFVKAITLTERKG